MGSLVFIIGVARMRNRIAVITGASKEKGVGAAIALTLAGLKYDLILNCVKNVEQAQRLSQKCQKLGADVEVVVGDLASYDTCVQIAKQASPWGKVDVLINCLGKTKPAPYSQLSALSKQDFLDLYEVNVIAPYLAVQALEPLLRKSPSPVIINISSAAGLTGKGSSIAYAAAKGGENTLTLALARALAPAIRVNAICPSFIDSSWWDESFSGKEEDYEKFIGKMKSASPLQKVLTPDLVAKEILNLIENTAITGEIVRLSCGGHL